MANDEPARNQTVPANRRGQLTPGLHKLASLGLKTLEVVESLFGGELETDRTFHPFAKWEDREWAVLADGLAPPWTDENAAEFLTKLHDLMVAGPGATLDSHAIERWLLKHPNDTDSVLDCVALVPPDGFTILSAMSRTGSQKRVYHARWKQGNREVVLKRLLGTLAQQEVVLERELQSHPLAMRHPNIIATHPLQNSDGDKFLVEEKLPLALNDGWQATGIYEAANLLHDIAQALAYLHGELGLVHGDIKPDNIGQKDGAYILLDFGICRPACKFSREATATGSLRTRAPELFITDAYPQEPHKIDVWAIGATVLKAMTGRFPFVDEGEKVPRISKPPERAAFEAKIARRIRDEWEKRLDLRSVPEPLRSVLARLLTRNPEERVHAKDIVYLCGQKLGAFLSGSGGGGVTIESELDQLLRYLPRNESARLMPAARKQQLRDRLKQLRDFPRVVRDRGAEIDALLKWLE